MENIKINTGVILEEAHPEDYVLGGISGAQDMPILFPDGHGWLKYQRPEETQKNRNFDSFSCVTYASLKSLSYYFKVVHGLDMDFSERFTAVMSGTIPGQGNSVRNVLESIRKDGFVLESDYPSMTPDMTQDQWFAPIPENIKKIALKNLELWDIKWEVLSIANPFTGEVSHDQIIEGQKKGVPITIGYARDLENGIIVDHGEQANHCFTAPEHEDNDPVVDLIIDDSYPADFGIDPEPDANYIFRASKNYSIRSSHIIMVARKGEPVSFITKFKKMLKNLQGYMDEHGLNIFYVDIKKGKQKIELTTMFEKALAMSYLKEGVIKTTSWPALVNMKDFKFF